MTQQLRFLPEIEKDILAGYTWYEDKMPGLGEEFMRMFFAGIHSITRNPHGYQKVHGEFRRSLVRRFPYAIYYRLERDKIIVFGLFHCARDPQFVRIQMQNRNELRNR